ncbi:MAG: hypothetical protein QOC71_1701, partial [Thermoplasmata archaeon]|nr:hypothetical protein [Thermoplasmata archaeon]
MRWAFAVAILALPAFAGCLDEVAEELGNGSGQFLPGSVVQKDPASAAGNLPSIASGVAAIHPGVMLSWEADCPCGFQDFVVQPTYGSFAAGWLDVRVRWDGTTTSGLEPRLVAPDHHGYSGGQRGFDDSLLRVWAPVS